MARCGRQLLAAIDLFLSFSFLELVGLWAGWPAKGSANEREQKKKKGMNQQSKKASTSSAAVASKLSFMND